MSMTEAGNISHRRQAVVVAMAVCMASLLPSMVKAQLDSESLRTVNEAKTRIEEAARTFIKDQQKVALRAKQPTTLKYGVGKAHYDAARASLNAWLDTVALDLKSDKRIEEIDERIPQLMAAVNKVDIFVNYAESGGRTPSTPVASTGEIVKSAAEILVAAFVGMAKTIGGEYFNNKDRKVRAGLLAEVARLKLKSFDELALEVR
jgi:hypothetical protein